METPAALSLTRVMPLLSACSCRARTLNVAAPSLGPAKTCMTPSTMWKEERTEPAVASLGSHSSTFSAVSPSRSGGYELHRHDVHEYSKRSDVPFMGNVRHRQGCLDFRDGVKRHGM